jgi:hypothetical protein
MSGGLFGGVLNNPRNNKQARKYDASVQPVGGQAGRGDASRVPRAAMSDSDGDDDGASKFKSRVTNEVRRTGKVGGQGAHGSPERMMGKAPSQMAELGDLAPESAGAGDLEFFIKGEAKQGKARQPAKADRDGDGSGGGTLSLHKKRGQQDSPMRTAHRGEDTGGVSGGSAPGEGRSVRN